MGRTSLTYGFQRPLLVAGTPNVGGLEAFFPFKVNKYIIYFPTAKILQRYLSDLDDCLAEQYR